MKKTAEEKQAAAASAAAARTKATEARKLATEAGGVDTELNAAATQAESEATEAEKLAADLSQASDLTAIERAKRKLHFVKQQLKELGADDDQDEDDEDDTDDIDLSDPTRVLTVGDLQRIKASESRKTAEQLADGVGDAAQAAAIKSALRTSVNPSLVASDPQAAFAAAQAIVYGGTNAKIIEEHNRKNGTSKTRITGAGAPPKHEEAFEPTAEEQKFMRGPMALTKEEVIKARG